MANRPEKKSERLEIRLPYSKKEAFLEACEQQSDTPSNAVRRFINGYIRRSNTDDLKFSLGVIWRRWFRPVPMAITAAICVAGLWMDGKFLPAETPEKDRYFAQIDKDRSGDINQIELNLDNSDYQIIMILLDKDDSKSLSLDEYQPQGEVGIMIRDANLTDVIDGSKPVSGILETKLVSYTLRPNYQVVSIWKKGKSEMAFRSDFSIFFPSDRVPDVLRHP